jgi:hypothetical protein
VSAGGRGWLIKVGDTVNVSVVVQNAKPEDMPLRYTWAGEFEGKPDTSQDKAIVINARPHNVQVTGPTARRPKPQVWSAQAGRLVDEEQQIAVFQDVSMRARVTPAPVNQPLHFQWSASPDGCSISNPSSQEPTFNCSQTGSVAALVTVRDNLGAKLGTGTGTIPVTISQASLQQSQAQAEAAKQAAKQEEAAQQAKLDAEKTAAAAAAQQAKLAATKTETPTKLPVASINIGGDRLGREWSVIEEGVPGRWVRRGNSDIWDGMWANGAAAILSMSTAGDKVKISRRDVAGPSMGLTSIYEGTLAPDGTMEITERDGAYQGRFNLRGGGWESMLDLRMDNGTISFRRPTTGGDQQQSAVYRSGCWSHDARDVQPGRSGQL